MINISIPELLIINVVLVDDANDLTLFPKLVDQRQFNRRARSWQSLEEKLWWFWIVQKGWHLHTNYLLEAKPVPVVGHKRLKSQSDFWE